jgi:hypothetical protein
MPGCTQHNNEKEHYPILVESRMCSAASHITLSHQCLCMNKQRWAGVIVQWYIIWLACNSGQIQSPQVKKKKTK